MTHKFRHSLSLSTSRVRHLAETTQDSNRKTALLNNSNYLPIYAMIKKIAGEGVASFYLECDNMEADQQRRYRNLLSKSLLIEERFRKVQHALTRYKNEEEMNKTFELYQNEKEKSVYNEPLQKELNEEEKIQKEFDLVIRLERKNYLRAEKLKIFSEKIERVRYLLFKSTITDLTHNFNYITPQRGGNKYKINRNYQIFDRDSKIEKYNNNIEKGSKLPNSFRNSLSNQNISKQQEQFEILYKEKEKKIENLLSELTKIKAIKQKCKKALIQRNESAKNLNILIEKRKQIFFESFNDQSSQSFHEINKKSGLSSSQKLFKSKIEQIQMRDNEIQFKKNRLMRLINEVELKNEEMIEKEQDVIQLEQKIIDIQKKYNETVFQSQKELDFLDAYSSMKSSSSVLYDTQYKDELQEILKKNIE